LATPGVADTAAEFFARSKARAERPFVVCIEAFTALDGGARVSVSKGEHVHPDHALLRTHREKFGIAPAKRSASRTGTAPKRADTAKPVDYLAPVPDDGALPKPSYALPRSTGFLSCDATVLRGGSTSPATVRVSNGARDSIARFCDMVPRDFETGGLLVARRERGNVVNITEAWGPGPSAALRRDSLELDWAAEHYLARKLCEESERRFVPQGMYHSHPSGTPTPSESDLRLFGGLMRAANDIWPLQFYVGLIVTNVDRSSGPDIAAWVTRRMAGSRRMICEEAEVER
jgi:proteasome lid subunit RPN8/RPN11